MQTPAETPPPSSEPTASSSSRKRQRSQSMEIDAQASASGSARSPPSSQNSPDSIDVYMANQDDDDGDLPLNLPAAPTWPNTDTQTKLSIVTPLKKKAMNTNETWYLVSSTWWGRFQSACSGEVDVKKHGGDGRVLERDLGPVHNADLLDQTGVLKKGLIEGMNCEYVNEELWGHLVAWYGQPEYPLARSTISRGGGPGWSAQTSLELYPPRLRAIEMARDLDPVGTPDLTSASLPSRNTPEILDSQETVTAQPLKHPIVIVSSQTTLGEMADALARAVYTPPVDAEPIHELPPYRIWKVTRPQDKAWGFDDPSGVFSTTLLKASDPKHLLTIGGGGTEEDVHKPALGTKLDECTFSNDVAAQAGAPQSSHGKAEGPSTEPDSADDLDQLSFVVEFADEVSWIIPDPQEYDTGEEDELVDEDVAPVPALFNRGENFFDAMSSGTKPEPKSTSVALYNTPAKSISKSVHPGTVGLTNLGNTCFMNSALQCLSNCTELTQYFLTGVYNDEINEDNPLGMGGKIAQAYGEVVRRLWAGHPLAGQQLPTSSLFSSSSFGGYGGYGSSYSSGSSTSFPPRDFKSALSHFAPQFQGYQQHDSQELVAFLLDGLHEDLNRVRTKPYVEKPDWPAQMDEIPKEIADRSPALAEDLTKLRIAKESWEGYMKRNDSVIVDLFQGQYQSRLVCPVCSKVSITFDPFMYLTLPLPIVKKWRHDIYYVPWDSTKLNYRIPVEINRDASFRDVRVLLARWMGTEADNLLTMEIFSHRFYKSLDDNVMCGEMAENDKIVCFEMPCHSRQSRVNKSKTKSVAGSAIGSKVTSRVGTPAPDSIRADTPSEPLEVEEPPPFLIPIYLAEARLGARETFSSFSHNSRPNLFGYPSVVPISHKAAASKEGIYKQLLESVSRWTTNGDLMFHLTDEAEEGGIEEVPIETGAPMEEKVTEVRENGDVVDVTTAPADDLNPGLKPDLETASVLSSASIARRAPKQDIFTMKLHSGYSDYGTSSGLNFNSAGTPVSWERRFKETPEGTPLLRDGDAIYLEFDEHMKEYYFGSEKRYEHALWDKWETFTHPEIEQARARDAENANKGISLQDCLDEFTKEEMLGEDDLWYCPQCKEHQQATKKFDLWKAPDVLVVHLKRFSNSRAMRDKIDALVDFPIEGLDLGNLVGERIVAKEMRDKGVDLATFGVIDPDEPLIYDLFGVDEHLGGLGGGHYRAYAQNHLNDKWYHFDDSFVSPAKATDAVNANAYLLFYRRRTARPLGGKSHDKIEEARLNPRDNESPDLTSSSLPTQLPTPPNEPEMTLLPKGSSWRGNLPPPVQVDDVDMSSMSRLFTNTDVEPASPSSSNEAAADSDDSNWRWGSQNSPGGSWSGHGSTQLEDSPFDDNDRTLSENEMPDLTPSGPDP